MKQLSFTFQTNLRQWLARLARNQSQGASWPEWAVLAGLIMPLAMMLLNIAMFGVALPTIRDSFGLQAEPTAWLATAYALPFMMFMPLYGRLGDELGKRRLFLLGITIFLVGTVIILVSTDLRLLLLGRAIQGAGSASIDPLCIAFLADLFPPANRGRAMGLWNTSAPLTTMVGLVLVGFLVDHLGWRTIFGPILLIGLAALVMVGIFLPTLPSRPQMIRLRNFDWGGVLLLSLTTVALVSFVSSRLITGVEAFHDWRLLLTTLLLLGAFIGWEKGQRQPFVPLDIFGFQNFSLASLGAGLRMFILTIITFTVPLYLTDVYELSATATGLVITLHSAALMSTVHFGGMLADKWGNRWLALLGAGVQTLTMALLGWLSDADSLGWVTMALVLNGLGSGLFLVPLHRAAMHHTPAGQTGIAAGLYSMGRFAGMVLGPAVGGVVLQNGLNQALTELQAYQMVFAVSAGVALVGIVTSWRLRE